MEKLWQASVSLNHKELNAERLAEFARIDGALHAVNVMRLAFTTGASISASTRASKSAPRCSSC